MKYDVKEAKGNVLLAAAILLFLFTLCIVLFKNDLFNKTGDDMTITTNMSFDGGTDSLSRELQYIIPYVDVDDPKYVTAYQEEATTISDIHNDILLTKGYFNNMGSEEFSTDLLLKKISELYGGDYFIVNKSFTVNGKNVCDYQDGIYSCKVMDYQGKLYKSDRKITNINISDSEIKLTESILFYSEEKIMNKTYYNVYDNGLYDKSLLSFSSNDLEEANLSFEDYINDNLESFRVDYQSSFIINGNNYNWIGTVIV